MDPHAYGPLSAAVQSACRAPESESLLDELLQVREAMQEAESRLPRTGLAGERAESARNLAHFLAMRRIDLRGVQERLAGLGLSSLGRAEPQVLASLERVIGVLRTLNGRSGASLPQTIPEPSLARRADALFGDASAARRTRIMVTLPSEAAHDEQLIETLVDAGMDVARINCAHDDAQAWAAMSRRVRRAARSAGRPVKVLMDLAGPKRAPAPSNPVRR